MTFTRVLLAEMMRRLVLASVVLFAGCSSLFGGGDKKSADAGALSFNVDTGADEKSLLYNLVGRWYPQTEITRLSDRTLTAKDWCEREPSLIFVVPEKIEVRCAKGGLLSATISEAKREKDGSILITTRTKEDAKLKQLRFTVSGPRAMISDSPCDDGPTQYARFPEFEILTREILGGQRCAQLAHEDIEKVPNE